MDRLIEDFENEDEGGDASAVAMRDQAVDSLYQSIATLDPANNEVDAKIVRRITRSVNELR